jgi:polygalacturonase
MTKIKAFAILLLSLCTLMLSAKDYKASMFGVKSDGVTLNTRSIQKAVDFISENGGGRLVFYVGRYLTGSIQLKSNVTIQLEEGAVLVGTTSVYDYYSVNGVKALISADSLTNIGITGKGVIEGQGTAVLENINTQISKGYLNETPDRAKPVLIYMNCCSKVTIEGINLWNACGSVQFYNECKDVKISRITVKSNSVADSRGILLTGCDGFKLTDSYFETSGTEISQTGRSKNVSVLNCRNEIGKPIQIKQ